VVVQLAHFNFSYMPFAEAEATCHNCHPYNCIRTRNALYQSSEINTGSLSSGSLVNKFRQPTSRNMIYDFQYVLAEVKNYFLANRALCVKLAEYHKQKHSQSCKNCKS